MITTTEDFEKARQELDAKANQNSNPSPVPIYISGGRYFHGFGKHLPSSEKKAA